MRKYYNLGLIGCGRWGANYISTINEMENVRITHLVTSNPENVALIKNCRAVAYKKPTDILKDVALDGVIIACPATKQAQIILDCIKHAIPFVCQKPFALNYLTALELSSKLKVYQTPCVVDHTQIFNPAFYELCNQIGGEKVTKITSEVRSFGPFRGEVSMLWDWCPHDVAMALFLIKEYPLGVDYKYTPHENYKNSGEVDLNLLFRTCDVKININNTFGKKYRAFTVHTKKKVFSIMDRELFRIKPDFRSVPLINATPLRKVVDNFILAIENSKQIGVELGVNTVKVLDECENFLIKNQKNIAYPTKTT